MLAAIRGMGGKKRQGALIPQECPAGLLESRACLGIDSLDTQPADAFSTGVCPVAGFLDAKGNLGTMQGIYCSGCIQALDSLEESKVDGPLQFWVHLGLDSWD